MNQTNRIAVLIILSAIIILLILAAKTEVMMPVMEFILTTEHITFFQFLVCIIASGAGLWLFYSLLNIVGGYYGKKFAQKKTLSSNSQGGNNY